MPFDGPLLEIDWELELRPAIEKWRVRLASMDPSTKATIDFESRSACDLKKHGSYIYSQHPTTEVMCLSYKLPSEYFVRRWHMAHPQHLISESPPPVELFAYVLAGGLVEAHNAFFEQVMWLHQMVVQYDWPKVPPKQWRAPPRRRALLHCLGPSRTPVWQ